MKKKFYSIVLSALTAVAASAQEFVVDGINYAVDEESEDKSEVNVIPFDDFKYYGNVVIPTTVENEGNTYKVTAIGDDAFSNCNSLLSVQMPESITYIGSGAFQYCNNLKQITLPAKLETINEFAFAHCPAITKVIIPNSVTEMGSSAFLDCKKLSSVTIGSGLETIEKCTFLRCAALKTITIPATVKQILKSAFAYTGLTTVTFASKDTEYDETAFGSTPWDTPRNQRSKNVMNNSRYHVKENNIVVY